MSSKRKSTHKRSRVAGRTPGGAKPPVESKAVETRAGEAATPPLACGCISPVRVCAKPGQRVRCSEHCAHRCCRKGLRASVDALIAAAEVFTAEEFKKVVTLLSAIEDFHSEAFPDEGLGSGEFTDYFDRTLPAMVADAQAKPRDYAAIVDQVKGLSNTIDDGLSQQSGDSDNDGEEEEEEDDDEE